MVGRWHWRGRCGGGVVIVPWCVARRHIVCGRRWAACGGGRWAGPATLDPSLCLRALEETTAALELWFVSCLCFACTTCRLERLHGMGAKLESSALPSTLGAQKLQNP